MKKLEEIVKEYKKSRYARNIASAENNFIGMAFREEELTYWSQKLTDEMNRTEVPVETVSAMING